MSGSVNRVQLLGCLGRDPEVRHTQSGSSVANMSLATEEYVKDGDNRTEWHRLTAWGKTADLCAQYLRKGSKVYVDGRLQTREWEDRSGNKRQTTEIIVNQVVFFDSRSETSAPPATRPDYDDGKFRPRSDTHRTGRQRDDDKDIPF